MQDVDGAVAFARGAGADPDGDTRIVGRSLKRIYYPDNVASIEREYDLRLSNLDAHEREILLMANADGSLRSEALYLCRYGACL
jgi:hypothetical protein